MAAQSHPRRLHEGRRAPTTAPSRLQQVVGGLAAGVLALGLIQLPVQRLAAIELLLGPVAVLGASVLLGPLGGALAGAISGAATQPLWGHSMAWVGLTLEGAAVGALRHRVRPVWADALWWLLGVPYVVASYRYGLELPWEETAAVAIKQALNGLLAALTVQVLLLTPSVRRRAGVWVPRPLREVGLAELVGTSLTLGVALPLMVVGAAEGRERYATERRQLEDRTLATARLTAESVDAALESVLNDASILADGLLEQLQATGALPPQARLETQLARHMRHNPWLTASYVGDARGQAVAFSPSQDAQGRALAGRSFADRSYFRRLVARPAPFISEVFQGRAGVEGPLVVAVAPVLHQGRLAAYVLFGVDLVRLRRLVAGHLVGAERSVLVDGAWQVVLDTGALDRRAVSSLQGTPLGQALAAQKGTGVGTYRVASNEVRLQQVRATRLFATAPVGVSGWRVVVEQPLQQLNRAVLLSYRALLTSLGLALAVLLVLAPLLSRLVAGPVEAVSQAAEALTRGDRRARPAESASLGPRETHQLATSFDRMATQLTQQLEALERASRERDQFLSVASHELKTPLTTLRLQVQLLARRLPEVHGETLEVLLRQLDRLSRLVNQMLDVSELESGRLQLEMRRLQLDALVARVASARVGAARSHRLVLRLEPAAVRGDAMRLEQAVHNLVDNAVRFSPEGGPVEVTLRRENGHGVLRVEDRGVGLAGGDGSRMTAFFQRYTRTTQPSVAQVAGLGVGLYFCREVALRHGGTIALEPREGGGARAILTLPLGGGATPHPPPPEGAPLGAGQ